MALPLIGSIAPETFAQANPFLTGWAAAQGIQDQGYKNQIDAATAKYADPTAAAALAYSQAQTPYLQAQTQQIYQGGIPKDQADANLANAQSKVAGMMAMANYLKSIGYYNRNSPEMLGVSASNTPAGQAVAANDPTVANNTVSNVKAITDGSAFFNALKQNGVQNPTANIPYPTSTPPQRTPLNAQVQQQNGQIFMGAAPRVTSNQPMVPLNQQIQPQNLPQNYPQNSPQNSNNLDPDAAALQNYIKNKIVNTNLTKGQQQQIVYDNSLQNTLQPLLKDLPSVAQYSGIAGHAELMKDKLNASAGLPVSANYQNYLDYMKVAPVIVNELRRAYGGQATDSENKMLSELVNPISWYTQPDQALKQFQTLMNAVHANTQAITQSKTTNLNQAANSPAMQVPQVAQNSTVQIPSFGSKEEFVGWFNKLSSDQQSQVRQQLGEQ